MSTMGEILKTERERKGYSQTFVAQNVNITTSYYSLIEKDQRTPSLLTAKRIADFYGIEVSLLAAAPNPTRPARGRAAS